MSFNTNPHHFRFALRETVRVIASGLVGTVISQHSSLYAQDQFLVQFHGTRGNPACDWLFADQLERDKGLGSCFADLVSQWSAELRAQKSLKQDGVDIDAAHHAEARSEESAVAQANVAADKPKPIFIDPCASKKVAADAASTGGSVATSYACFNLGHNGASVSLYIPDIEQKPGEPLADFLLRAAAALQGQATTL